MTYPYHDNFPSMKSYYRAATEAQNGSERLRQAMNEQFRAFAARHRVTFEDARTMLMNGVSL